MQQEPPDQKIERNVQNVAEKAQEQAQNVVEQAQQEVVRSRVPRYRLLKRAHLLIGFYLIQFILFTLLAWFVHVNPILPVDVVITREFQENTFPLLSNFMIAVSYLGNHSIVFVILIVLTALVFWLVRLRLEALLILALSLVSALFNVAIKLLVSRPRPTVRLVDVLQTATGASFPSGHVMSYVAFFGLLFSLSLILFRRDRFWHYALLIISALFVILVGPSRIYLGDHWASDVLGGYLFGGMLLGISLWIYLKLKEKGVLQR